MDEQMIELIARAIFEAHNATYKLTYLFGGPAKWESDPEHWRRYARAAHSVMAGKVAELTEAATQAKACLGLGHGDHPDAVIREGNINRAWHLLDAALAPHPERRSEPHE